MIWKDLLVLSSLRQVTLLGVRSKGQNSTRQTLSSLNQADSKKKIRKWNCTSGQPSYDTSSCRSHDSSNPCHYRGSGSHQWSNILNAKFRLQHNGAILLKYCKLRRDENQSVEELIAVQELRQMNTTIRSMIGG